MKLKLLGSAVLFLTLTGVAAAHDSWLEPSRFATVPGARVPIAFYVGHHGEQRSVALDTRPKWLVSMATRGLHGATDLLKRSDFKPGRGVRFAAPGTHIVSLGTSDFRNEMSPEDFPAYMKEEGLSAAEAAWKRSPVTSRKVREVYRRYAKALVQVGAARPTDDGVATRRLGQPLEIVPAASPHLLRKGDPLRATIWFGGRPLEGALVTLGSLDRPKDELIRIRSDAAGAVDFRLPGSGRWMLNVVWSVPAARAGSDYQTSFSSLTFAVPAAR